MSCFTFLRFLFFLHLWRRPCVVQAAWWRCRGRPVLAGPRSSRSRLCPASPVAPAERPTHGPTTAAPRPASSAYNQHRFSRAWKPRLESESIRINLLGNKGPKATYKSCRNIQYKLTMIIVQDNVYNIQKIMLRKKQFTNYVTFSLQYTCSRPREDQRRPGKRLYVRTVKHVSWIKRMPWTVANRERW